MKRKSYVDALRGIGIILVVLGHRQIHHGLYLWLYAFHMPLFFFLSGYTEQFVKTQKKVGGAIKLLYPYFVMGAVVIIYNTVKSYFLEHSFSIGALNKRMIALMYGNVIWENNVDYIGTLWFLAALLCVKVLYLAVGHIKEKKVRNIAAAGIVLSGCLWSKVFALGIRLPLCFDVALVGFFFYYLGAEPIFHMEKEHYSVTHIGLCILALAAGSGLAFLNCHLAGIDSTSMLGMAFGYIILYFLTAVLIIVSLLEIFKAIYNGKRASSLRVLPAIGRRSLIIMAFHVYALQIFSFLLNDTLNIGVSDYIIAGLGLTFTFFISIIVERYMPFIYKIPRSWSMCRYES